LRLQRVLCDFGSEQSFAGAANRVLEHYGFLPSVSEVRITTLRHARRAGQALEQRDAQTFRQLPARGAPHLIAQGDGTMICTVESGPRQGKRPRQWKEMRLVAAQAQDSVECSYAAGFKSVEAIGRAWGHCAKQAQWGLNTQVHVVADGAPWIYQQSREVFGEKQHFLLDYYHVGQYLAQAAATCRAERPDLWRRTQQKRLLRGSHAQVLGELEKHLEAPETPEQSAPVRAAYRYLCHRSEQLNYPRAVALKLPIGSGLIESGHRHVLQRRLKQPGTAWLASNADAMAQLRVLRVNGQWSSLWS
jgi:hypothetical protein